LRNTISDQKRSEIIELYMRGWTRDDIAEKTGVSTGGVSGVIKEFTERADSSSLDEAAKEYGVAPTVESLRELAVRVKKNETSVEDLIALSNTLERIKQLVPPERLEEFARAGESLGDKAHVEASVRMYTIEQITGKSHDDIVADLGSKLDKIKELSSEIQRLNSDIKNLNTEKANLEAELSELLRQRNLTLERIERVAKIESELSKHNIDLTKIEELHPIFDTVEQSGYDSKKVVEQLRKEGSLKAQIEADRKNLADIQERLAKLNDILSSCEDKLRKVEPTVGKADALVSMGWNIQSLERVAKLTKSFGSVEEVLDRVELVKRFADAKAELERVRAETNALKEENLKAIKETSKNLSVLTKESSILVDEKIPPIMAQLSNLADRYNNLVEKYTKLDEEYRKLRKRLEEALNWSTLLQEPEKLPSNTIRHIFFDIMIPKLEIWCKRNRERLDILKELAGKAMYLYLELQRTL